MNMVEDLHSNKRESCSDASLEYSGTISSHCNLSLPCSSSSVPFLGEEDTEYFRHQEQIREGWQTCKLGTSLFPAFEVSSRAVGAANVISVGAEGTTCEYTGQRVLGRMMRLLTAVVI
uniref:Testis cDNA clone: QtsA-11120, similar to human hypothetical protein FLJ37464 (FLJ37464) n=1 Tax=Macaca fascicularis TaxID=9541 RepID=Q4R8Y7_MACFA|nr:unnamed protein product [Macaca fascicularis]